MALQASLALLLTAFLFGGMLLFSFAFAAFLFTHLPAADAGKMLRRAFPHFYLGVIIVAAVAALLYVRLDAAGAVYLSGVALSTLPARQLLMPAINEASDTGDRSRFNRLHGLSVVIGILQIVVVGYVLVRSV
ncbi:MAG: DUF4149 domain-containing protein [Chromatocurvus sp.]